MDDASINTSYVFAYSTGIGNAGAMLTADEILAELERRKVSRAALAKVLGVAQPNATRLYVPDPRSKSQEPRALTWDEGCKIIEAFKLRFGDGDTPAGHASEPPYLNEKALLPIVETIVEIARRDHSDEAAEVLTTGLARYLEQLDEKPSIRSNRDALEAVAQTAVPRLPQSKH